MTHPRQTLRDATKALLEGIERDGTVLTFELARATEVQSKAGVTLAWGDISTPTEASARADKSGSLDRTVDLFISLQIDGDDPTVLQDELDAWAELIEDRLRTNTPAPAKRCTLTNTTLDRGLDEQGVKWLAFLDMQYAAQILA
jgi:hypothetical protein